MMNSGDLLVHAPAAMDLENSSGFSRKFFWKGEMGTEIDCNWKGEMEEI